MLYCLPARTDNPVGINIGVSLQTETEDGLPIPGTFLAEFVAGLREQRGLRGRF
jgi:hypothetical protein